MTGDPHRPPRQVTLDGRCQAYAVSPRGSVIETVTLPPRSNNQAWEFSFCLTGSVAESGKILSSVVGVRYLAVPFAIADLINAYE